MSVVRVVIPVLKGKRRFHLLKGRPWSVVEHVFLAALVTRPRTLTELADEANVPRRLVVEVLIRLMRAGWVALSQNAKGVIFSASMEGKDVVDDEELPHVAKPISRWMNFVIDRVTGTLYRTRDLPFFEKHVLEQRAKRERLVWIEPREMANFDETGGVLAMLFEDDEKFMGLEPAGDRLVDRYSVVAVRNGIAEGLPARAPSELQKLVLEAAASAGFAASSESLTSFRPGPAPSYAEQDAPQPIDAVFADNDLIVGAKAHEELLTTVLRRAKRRLIIHSTFITENRFALVKHLLLDAVKRGVLVDILWGEDEAKSALTSTRQAVTRIRAEIAASGFESGLRVHAFSTRSHAKLLIADAGVNTAIFAVIGSCNWLSSTFEAFEASIRLSDPRLVSVVLEQLAELTRGNDGHWTDLTSDITRLAAEERARPIPSGRRAKLGLVLGPQHARYVRMARDTAKERLFITSHRMGAATRPAIVVPAIAAAQDRGVKSKVYYGLESGIAQSSVADIRASAEATGVTLTAVAEPRLHAKVLAWDSDNLLVTSQNWLSADPSEANLRREIGVFVNAPGIARIFIDSFEALRRS